MVRFDWADFGGIYGAMLRPCSNAINPRRVYVKADPQNPQSFVQGEGSPRRRSSRQPALLVVRQCRLLSLSRSTAYYRPRKDCDEKLAFMKAIDRLYIERPTSGSVAR